MRELIPEYATVVMLLKTKKIKVLVYEMSTNRCQEFFENQSTTDRNKTIRKHKRNEKAVENIIMFIKDFPIKPDNVLKLREWKENIQNAINIDYENLKECVILNKVIKPTKSGDIAISSIQAKKSVIFFDNYWKTNNDQEE